MVYHDFRFIRNIKEGPSPGEKTVVQLVATVHICKLNPPSPQHFTTDCYKIVPKTVAQIGNQTGRRKRHVRQNFKQTLRLTICATVVGTILTVCFTLIFTLSHRPLKTWGWPSSPFAILSDQLLKLKPAGFTKGAHQHRLGFCPPSCDCPSIYSAEKTLLLQQPIMAKWTNIL